MRPGLALALGVLSLPGPTAARRSPGGLHVYSLTGALEGEAQWRSEVRSLNGVSDWTLRTTSLSESLSLRTRGDLYHPRFLGFQLGGLVGGEHLMGEGRSAAVGAADLHLTLLAEHPVGATADLTLGREQVQRSFARVYELDRTAVGGRVQARGGPAPAFVAYDHRRRGGVGSASEVVNETDDEVRAGADYDHGDHHGRLRFERLSGQSQGHRRRQEVISAQHGVDLNRSRGDLFRISLRTQNRVAERATRSTQSIASLQVTPVPSIRLSAQLNGQLHTTGGQTQRAAALSLGARHQLYESLTTALQGTAEAEQASFGDRTLAGGTGSQTYTKRLGSWGRLTLAYGGLAEWTDEAPSASSATALDEPLSLNEDAPVFLARRRPRPQTLVITDSTGLELYRLGRDYEVLERGERLEILRMPTGLIEAGESVLATYDYDLAGAGEFLTTGENASASLRVLEYLDVYVRSARQRQSLLAGSSTAPLDSGHTQVGGVSISGGWFDARADVERTVGRFSAYWGVSQELSISAVDAAAWRARLSLGQRLISDDESGRMSRQSARGDAALRFARNLSLELKVDWFRERWEESLGEGNDVDAVGAEGALRWLHRQLFLEVTGRLSHVSRGGQREQVQEAYLRLRRRL